MKEERVGQLFLGGIIFFGVVIVGGLVLAFMAGPSPSRGGDGTVETNLHFIDDTNPAKGPGEAKIIVRMFGDFQCPSCRAAETGVQYAMRTYGDRVRFIWNDFPLSTIHPNARAAASAARCAEEHGKFWEFHDALFREQSSWADLSAPTEKFVSYARQLGMPTEDFASCIAVQKHLRKIQDDEAEGNANRVKGTPTFFIGNKRLVGVVSQATWDSELQAALAE